MKIIQKKQIWKGTFTYLDGYELKDQYIAVSFDLQIQVNDNSFLAHLQIPSQNLFSKINKQMLKAL